MTEVEVQRTAPAARVARWPGTLEDLICETEGVRKWALSKETGEQVHVTSVPSGLACGCSCQKCGRDMVARKGQKNRHGFAHRGLPASESCIGAGETAVHMWAKQVLVANGWMTLPDRHVGTGRDREFIHGGRWDFPEGSVTVEPHFKGMRPDLAVDAGHRLLFVEVMVTHATGPEKVALVKARGDAMLEIDLSRLRATPLDELADLVLEGAPRAWLHNPRDDEILLDHARLVEKREAAMDAVARRIAAAYRHRVLDPDDLGGRMARWAIDNGLREAVGRHADGAGCFDAPHIEWQALVLRECVMAHPKPLTLKNALAAVDRAGLLEKGLDCAPFVEMRVRRTQPFYRSPDSAVRLYMEGLVSSMHVAKSAETSWRASPWAVSAVEASERRRLQPIERMARAREVAEELLAMLPQSEAGEFDLDDWLRTPTPGKPSPEEAAQGGDADWRAFLVPLESMKRTLFSSSPQSLADLMGLPLEAERARHVERVRGERADRAYKALEDRMRAYARRGRDELDGDVSWLETPNDALGGKTPLEAVRDGMDSAAERALRDEASRRRMETELAEAARDARERLEIAAARVYFREDERGLFLRSGRPELGFRSPMDYVVDVATLEKVTTLLEAIRKSGKVRK